MRINDTKYGLYSYQNQQNRTNISTTPKKTMAATDDVKISTRGREISQSMMSEQAQRQNRIQELKHQIETGTYTVDSNKIAQKIVDFWSSNTK
jgi:negative regulator of flagellin synthesis FlgM